ncbi:hypothetical protein GCM10010199_61700 [Dactylosporangium roseum]
MVTGSRTWDDEASIRFCLDTITKEALAAGDDHITVVHGACPSGADAIADKWTRERGLLWPIRAERHPALWDTHGKRAGFARNNHMVSLGADLCMAFIRDRSNGATHCANAAEAAGIPVKVIDYDDVTAARDVPREEAS